MKRSLKIVFLITLATIIIIINSIPKSSNKNIVCSLPFTEEKSRIENYIGIQISGAEVLSLEEKYNDKYPIYFEQEIERKEKYLVTIEEYKGIKIIIINKSEGGS